jgi:hypothetical protein
VYPKRSILRLSRRVREMGVELKAVKADLSRQADRCKSTLNRCKIRSTALELEILGRGPIMLPIRARHSNGQRVYEPTVKTHEDF